MIGIIDYNAGNIRSVEHALNYLGFDNIRSKDPRDLANTDRVIFPGDGDALYAMGQLEQTGYASFLKDCAASGKPILGICVGAQIIFDFSEEGDVECLGLVRGAIRHLPEGKLKVPHMGWNDLRVVGRPSPLFEGIDMGASYYFVHSYMICPTEKDVVVAVADYGVPVPAVIQKGSIHALQFHPEKSGPAGLQILKNFASTILEVSAPC
jgi:glutamine amidotransferase